MFCRVFCQIHLIEQSNSLIKEVKIKNTINGKYENCFYEMIAHLLIQGLGGNMRGDLWQKGGCLVVGVGGNPVYMQYTQVIYIYIYDIHAVLG